MNKKQKEQKLLKLTEDYMKANAKADSIKKQMQELRKEISETPDWVEERPDEIYLKHE
jgi:hypothetical protein